MQVKRVKNTLILSLLIEVIISMEIEDYDYSKNSRSMTKEEKMAFLDRFKRACRSKGMTLQQLQVQIGRKNGYFRNMGYISPKMAVEVKKVLPDLNIEYINKGVGEMFITPDVVKAEMEKKKHQVPLIPIRARGGTLLGFSEGVRGYECELVISPIDNAEMAVPVTGDSMAPEYPSGSVVLIKRINEKAFIEWGRTYVLDTCNGAVIKKLYPIDGDESQFVCRSINPAFPDFKVKYTDVYAVYRVLGSMSLR